MDQLKKWKEEFHKEFALTNCVDYSDSHGFADHEVDLLWRGFKAAKRSHPVVELPKIGMCFGKAPFSYFLADQTVESLTAAGIQYRIKGE